MKLTCTEWKKVPIKMVDNIIGQILLIILIYCAAISPIIAVLKTYNFRYLLAYPYWLFLWAMFVSEKKDCLKDAGGQE